MVGTLYEDLRTYLRHRLQKTAKTCRMNFSENSGVYDIIRRSTAPLHAICMPGNAEPRGQLYENREINAKCYLLLRSVRVE